VIPEKAVDSPVSAAFSMLKVSGQSREDPDTVVSTPRTNDGGSMGERLTDDAWQQVRIAADDLIKYMGQYRVAFEQEVSDLMSQNRVRENPVIRKDAEYQASKCGPVKQAESDCHWAAERAVAFSAIYQSAVTRGSELAKRHSQTFLPSDI
jgi:hypothetical protein